jgi:hypothetical protein
VKPEERVFIPEHVRVFGFSLTKTLEAEKKISVMLSLVSKCPFFRCLLPIEVELEQVAGHCTKSRA